MALQITPLLLVAAALFGALASAGRPDFMQYVDACQALYPVQQDAIRTLHRTGKFPDESDENARCNTQCMMSKIGGLVDSNGNFDVSAAKKGISKHNVLYGSPGTKAPSQSKINSVVDQCSTVNEEGNCMTNYKIWTCMYAKFHKA